MKYLYWLSIIINGMLTKLIGVPIFYMVLPFRSKIRHKFHLGSFQRGYFMKEFEDLGYIKTDDGWIVGINNSRCENGFIKDTGKVNTLSYYFNFLLWIWLDDGSNRDTWDAGYTKTYVDSERNTYSWLLKKLEYEYDHRNDCQFGNTFELLDKRSNKTWVAPFSTFLWIIRNTAYNFNYRFNTITNYKNAWQIKSESGALIGWRELSSKNNNRYFRLEYVYKEGEPGGSKLHKVDIFLEILKGYKTNKLIKLY